MPRRHRYHLRSIATTMLSVIAIVMFFCGVRTEAAGPSPVSGATVYQGVVTVASDNSAILELGNAGTDIASSGTIALRPNGATMTAVNGVQIESNGAGTPMANLLAPGGICFNGVCSDTWPTPGVGASFWQLIAGHYLQPVAITTSLQFAKTSNRGLFSVDAVANNSDTAVNVSNTAGTAGKFDSGLTIGGDVLVGTTATPNEIVFVDQSNNTYPVWHAGNDGHTATGTGPDASKLDGTNLEFRYVPSAVNSLTCAEADMYTGDRHCFCAQISSGTKCLWLQ